MHKWDAPILLFYGFEKGDEVILPAQTHIATAHAIELMGAVPVFVDSNLEDGNIDIKKIEKKLIIKQKLFVSSIF